MAAGPPDNLLNLVDESDFKKGGHEAITGVPITGRIEKRTKKDLRSLTPNL